MPEFYIMWMCGYIPQNGKCSKITINHYVINMLIHSTLAFRVVCELAQSPDFMVLSHFIS